MKKIIAIVLGFIILIVFNGSIYILNETEQAIITEFGKPHGKPYKIRYRLSKFERRLHRRVKPFMKIMAKVFRRLGVCISLKEMLRNPALRKLLFQHVLRIRSWREIALKGLLRELVLLDFLKRVKLAGSSSINHFKVLTIRDFKKKNLVFISQPETSANQLTIEGDFVNYVDTDFTWSDLEYALNNGGVKQMLWDHSSIDTTVKYPISKSIYITINVGVDGIEKFDSLMRIINKK